MKKKIIGLLAAISMSVIGLSIGKGQLFTKVQAEEVYHTIRFGKGFNELPDRKGLFFATNEAGTKIECTAKFEDDVFSVSQSDEGISITNNLDTVQQYKISFDIFGIGEFIFRYKSPENATLECYKDGKNVSDTGSIGYRDSSYSTNAKSLSVGVPLRKSATISEFYIIYSEANCRAEVSKL